MPRVFVAGCIGETRASVRYLVRKKKKGLERVYKLLLESKESPLPSQQSGKFKCQILSEITKKLTKKCLDASSLLLSKKKVPRCV